MKTGLNDFKQFMKEREVASNAFVNGDFAPLNRISTQVSPASIYGPMGDYIEGAKNVNAANARGAAMFESGSENTFEIQQLAASDGIASWAGIQRSTVRMKGELNPVPMDLRVTEVFRREGDAWKLIHRHADMLKVKSAD